MSTVTAVGAAGALAAPGGATVGALDAAGAALAAPLFFALGCALATSVYAASGSTKARPIVTRSRMRIPLLRTQGPTPSRGADDRYPYVLLGGPGNFGAPESDRKSTR